MVESAHSNHIDPTDINDCPQMKEGQQNLISRSQQRRQSSDTEGSDQEGKLKPMCLI